MARQAFFDAMTYILKAHGFMATNEPGDIVIGVPDDFDKEPGSEWRWDGGSGVRPATAQELADYNAAKLDAEALVQIDGAKALKALLIWLAPLVGKTAIQARDEIIAIYKGL